MKNFSDESYFDEKETEKTAAQIKAAIRTVFVVSALSFHSTIEGIKHAVRSLALYLKGRSY